MFSSLFGGNKHFFLIPGETGGIYNIIKYKSFKLFFRVAISVILVDSDIKKTAEICVVDEDLVEVKGNIVKIGVWYNNEAGYANQVIEVIRKKYFF